MVSHTQEKASPFWRKPGQILTKGLSRREGKGGRGCRAGAPAFTPSPEPEHIQNPRSKAR